MLDTLSWVFREVLFLFLVFLPILLLLSSSGQPPIDIVYLAQATTTTFKALVRRHPRPPRIEFSRHPHIVEAILRHSDTQTLQAFRLTTSRLCLLSYTLLSQHVTITDENLEPQPAGVPFVPQYPDLVPGWRATSSYTRILDIQYGAKWQLLIREVGSLLSRLPSLELVRVHNSVRELDYMLARRERFLLPNAKVNTVHFHDLTCDIRPVLRGSIPYGGGDVFINLRHSRNRPPTPLGTFDGGPGPSGYVVYLFLTLASGGHDHIPRLNRAGAPAVEAWRALLPYLAGQVVQFIVSASSENTYIFVGDRDDTPSPLASLGRRSVMTPRDRRRLVRLLDKELRALLAEGYFSPQAARNRVERQVGFATFEDIEEMVGPDLFPLIMAP